MLYVGRFASLKESSLYDKTLFVPCMRVLISTQVVAKNEAQGHPRKLCVGGSNMNAKINVKNQHQNDVGITITHTRCAWAGAIQMPKIKSQKIMLK